MKKLLKMLKIHTFLFLTLISLTSCSFLSTKPYQKVSYFTLGNDEQFEKTNYNVTINVFRSLLPEKFRMIYIKNQYQVYIDDYNKWIQPPEFMLKKYLNNKFAYQSQETNFMVSGTIENFDIDTDNFEVRINVTYKIYEKNDVVHKKLICARQFNKKTKFKKLDPKAFAKAFTLLSNNLAEDIRNSINNYLEEATDENK